MKRLVITVMIVILITFIVICGIRLYLYSCSARLCRAIHEGDTKRALEIIETPMDVNSYTDPLWTAKLKSIVDESVELPLVVACYEGDYEVVKVLLEKGADPNKYRKGSWSPIEATFIKWNKKRVDIAKELINYGADVDLKGSRTTALFNEIILLINSTKVTKLEEETSEKAINLLINNGASLIDIKNDTVISLLACYGNVNLLESVIDNFDLINVQNKYGKTALHRAAENNAYDMALFLVEKGIDTSIKDANGQTAYDYAVQSNNKDIIALLEKYVK